MQFSQIYGQGPAIHILKQSIRNHHVAHAYLFTGPEGIGKKQTALAMAQYLNCTAQDMEATDSCGQCPSCIQASHGSQPDILLLSPDEKGSIKIEPIRNLIAQVSLQSYESTYKIAIIDDAHLMTTDAANCLLKTLEEPTENTIFILITSRFQRLPATILSRCQQVTFHPLSTEQVRNLLLKRYPEQRSRIGMVAALSQGSMVIAEDLLENEDFSAMRSRFCELLLQLSHTGAADLITWCEQWKKNRRAVQYLLEIGQIWYHDLLLLATLQQPDLLVNQDYVAELRQLHITPLQAADILQLYQTGIVQLTEHNASPELVLNIVLLKTKQTLSLEA